MQRLTTMIIYYLSCFCRWGILTGHRGNSLSLLPSVWDLSWRSLSLESYEGAVFPCMTGGCCHDWPQTGCQLRISLGLSAGTPTCGPLYGLGTLTYVAGFQVQDLGEREGRGKREERREKERGPGRRYLTFHDPSSGNLSELLPLYTIGWGSQKPHPDLRGESTDPRLLWEEHRQIVRACANGINMRGDHLWKSQLIVPFSLLCSPTAVIWDHLPNQQLTSRSLSQGLCLWGNPNEDITQINTVLI